MNQTDAAESETSEERTLSRGDLIFRREVIRAALRSREPATVLAVAEACLAVGMPITCHKLREHAATLEE